MTQDMTPREAALAERVERLRKALEDAASRAGVLGYTGIEAFLRAALDADGEGEGR